MLIYNFQKEFLGIDEEDLNALGFSNLQELRTESADFADMFVKTPGHVHNFAHVHWIDFVICADFHEDSKVIIHAHNKNYKCTIEAKTAYLVDNPSQKAYLIYLSNIYELNAKENEQISKDIYDKPIPVSTTVSNPIFNTPEFDDSFQQTTQSNDLAVIDEYDIYREPETLKKEPLAPKVIEDNFIEESSIAEQVDAQDIDTEIKKEIVLETLNDADLVSNDEYEYDPEVASKALGLPVDLIEEFLQDFIAQSKEFEPELYDSLEKDDLSNVKILSHKLKGVAANLRVEDAYDALTIINSIDDYHEIKASLVTFYKIISKLAGETTTEPSEEIPKEETSPVVSKNEGEEFIIDFKDDTVMEKSIPNESSQKNTSYIEDTPLEFKDDILEIKFNKNLAASEIGIDIESYNELLKDFIEENLTSIGSINKAIDEGDFQMWKKHAIKLKGMSDNMRINLFMQELETIIDTEDTATAKKTIHDIATKLTQIPVIEA